MLRRAFASRWLLRRRSSTGCAPCRPHVCDNLGQEEAGTLHALHTAKQIKLLSHRTYLLSHTHTQSSVRMMLPQISNAQGAKFEEACYVMHTVSRLRTARLPMCFAFGRRARAGLRRGTGQAPRAAQTLPTALKP
jgi:hypothetical protein